MLVLSRKLGERIVVDDDVVVTVLAIRGGTVKLGFSGPADVAIHREEVYKRIEGSQPAARTASGVKRLICSPKARARLVDYQPAITMVEPPLRNST